MPRRLGDDPLSRKRPASRSKATPATRQEPPTFQASHNDVFFRRRTEDSQPKPESAPDNQLPILGDAANIDERPEITEVSEIMRTVQVANSTQGSEQLAGPVPADEPVPPSAEEPVEKGEEASTVVSEPIVAPEPSPPVTEQPAAPASSESEPQPQKSEGFFKRLFGRFGK